MNEIEKNKILIKNSALQIEEIIGTYYGDLVWRCYQGFYHSGLLNSLGIDLSEYSEYSDIPATNVSTYYDYLNSTKLKEITDNEIISKIKKVTICNV